MTQPTQPATPPPKPKRWGTLPSLMVAALAAAALLTGLFNVRSAFGGPGWATEPPPPSAVDALVGAPERAATRLDGQIASLQAALRSGDAAMPGRAAARLGQAYLQKARETGDPGYYPRAEALFNQALAADAADVEALVGQGSLALARHRFADALAWGERAQAANPYHAPARGVVVDALVELGRYDAAVDAAQAMVDLRPDLASYSRVSYLRELMGDRAGAIVAMEQATTAGAAYPENVAWVAVQLGNLRFDGGDLAGAERDYAEALAVVPAFVPAVAGQAKLAAARGDLDRAATLYADAVARLPLPEFAIAYGDVLTAAGREQEAAAQYALVEAIEQINAANGVDTDLELALFAADRAPAADLPAVVERAKRAALARPSIVAADVLAWALYRAGDLDGAAAASKEALRLGTDQPLLRFHAGMIAAARGERAAAIAHLEGALAANPAFSVRHAPEAQAALERLRAEEGGA